jgi:hypothetical protein
MRIKRQSVNVAGKKGEECAEEEDVMAGGGEGPLYICFEEIMDCDADEIASEHQSNDSKRAA